MLLPLPVLLLFQSASVIADDLLQPAGQLQSFFLLCFKGVVGLKVDLNGIERRSS